jgi:hypothetical protein
VTQDGKVNPDTKELPGINSLNSVTKATIYSTLAYVFSKQDASVQNAVSFIETFFLKNETAMSPNMNYGQVVRGPQSQTGGYTGILDMRVTIKVVNSILLLRSSKSPLWTLDLDASMVSWAKTYVKWLQTSDLGKHASGSAKYVLKSFPIPSNAYMVCSNHGTFFAAQLAALQILVGDSKAVIATVRSYFAGPFQEQVTASGEQVSPSDRSPLRHSHLD